MPWAFFELWTEVTGPVFPALFGVAVDFVLVEVEFVELLGNFFPVMDFAIVFEAFVVSIFDDGAEEIGLIIAPGVMGESDFFETEPLEHADFAIDSGNEGGNEFPVLLLLRNKK